ncbi:SRPBCC domain-containing protein [Mycobacterium sp. E3247]|uniref:SRPBCC family protein n=1 Tax=Mycobacterium sp. E3247 TaxID=1856864 RepID=UPI0007FF3837|nr:SRPBCC domain-containing protein [Mycobacterium sp. E3247]OBH09758.1 polyketide cyclase [Mycobacterium sp. E3247]
MPVTDVQHDLENLTLTITADFAAPVQRIWQVYAGYWEITTVDEPTSFSFLDGFADPDFNPKPDLPVSVNVYTFAEHGGGTRATYVSTYESAEALQQVLDMGVVEGASSAINQIDDLLAS